MASPQGHGRFEVRTFDTIDSTNRYLLEEAAGGAAEGLVAVANHQSAGRGRRGRVWDSKPGSSLLFSILFRPGAIPLHRYGQIVSLAVVEACAEVGGFTAALKWPNDLLVGTRKLAGVLGEAATTGTDHVLVVGCGLNLNWNGALPEALPGAISADEAAGHTLDRDTMLAVILAALAPRLDAPELVAEEYRSRCATLGQRVRVEREAGDLEGQAVDVADSGALVLDVDGARHEVSVGEAIHLRPA